MEEFGIEVDFSKITNGTKFYIVNFIIIIAYSLKKRLEISKTRNCCFAILDPRFRTHKKSMFYFLDLMSKYPKIK